MSDGTGSTGPYKGEGETVYATESAEGSGATVTDGKPKHQQKGWLYQQYHAFGKNQREISDLAGVSQSIISKWMNRHGIDPRDPGKAMSLAQGGDERLFDAEWLREQYSSNSALEIAEVLDVSWDAVYAALERAGIDRRDKSEATELAMEKEYGAENYNDPKWLYHQYWRLGKSIHTIASANGWSYETVREALIRHQICIRSRRAAQLLRYKKEKGVRHSEDRDLVTSEGIDASWADLKESERGLIVPWRDKKWLQDCVDSGLSTRDIAEVCEVDVDSTTIWRWTRRLNIVLPD